MLRWVQAVLGTLTAGLYFLLTRRAFASRWAASLIGVLCAVHPFWIINTAEINDGVMATFLLALALFLGSPVNRSIGFLPSWLYGLALGGLA